MTTKVVTLVVVGSPAVPQRANMIKQARDSTVMKKNTMKNSKKNSRECKSRTLRLTSALTNSRMVVERIPTDRVLQTVYQKVRVLISKEENRNACL